MVLSNEISVRNDTPTNPDIITRRPRSFSMEMRVKTDAVPLVRLYCRNSGISSRPERFRSVYVIQPRLKFSSVIDDSRGCTEMKNRVTRGVGVCTAVAVFFSRLFSDRLAWRGLENEPALWYVPR